MEIPAEPLLDGRDQRMYRTVRIGHQVWMAENFAYLPTVSPADSAGSVWVYGYEGNDENEARQTPNYARYGCLYTLKAAKQYCPPSWRVPTPADIEKLAAVLGQFGNTSVVLRAIDGARIIQGGDSGFNARLGGCRSGPCLKHMPWGAKSVLGEFEFLENSFHCLLDEHFTAKTHGRDERVSTFYLFRNPGEPVSPCDFGSINVNGAASVRFIRSEHPDR